MIALGQVMARGRNQLGMSQTQAEKILREQYRVKVSDTTLGRLEDGSKGGIEPDLMAALVDLYGLEQDEAYTALKATLGIAGAQKYVLKSMQSGRYDQAMAMIRTMASAA